MKNLSETVVYPVAGIPTIYRGRRYRSRLEARWAAYFDHLGWNHEYEPFDLNGWIPDFLLRGCRRKVLVEVKPITEFDAEVALKMLSALPPDQAEYSLLLVGVAPTPIGDRNRPLGIQLGWTVFWFMPGDSDEYELAASNNEAVLKLFYDGGKLHPDYADVFFNFSGILTSWDSHYYFDFPNNSFRPDVLDTSSKAEASLRFMQAWAEASNLVQWKGARR